MFELADYLIGIYKVKDCTETVCIRNAPPTVEAEAPESPQKQSVAEESVVTAALQETNTTTTDVSPDTQEGLPLGAE